MLDRRLAGKTHTLPAAPPRSSLLSTPVFPLPPHLLAILEAAGFKPTLTATRADREPLAEADMALLRRLLAAYGNGEARASDAELSAGLRALRAHRRAEATTATEPATPPRPEQASPPQPLAASAADLAARLAPLASGLGLPETEVLALGLDLLENLLDEDPEALRARVAEGKATGPIR